MYYNYHTHTYRCKHASGTSEEIIKKAISLGFKEIGISEHLPHLTKPYNMSLEENEDYLNELKILKEKYKDQIKVLIGYEAEYFKGEDEFYLNLFKKGIDYLILGNHHTHKTNFWRYNESDKYDLYLENIENALKTGFFSAITHPDLIFINDERDDLPPKKTVIMDKIIDLAVKYDVVLEINCEGYRANHFLTKSGKISSPYPRIEFIEKLANNKAKVMIGSDSHELNTLKDEVTTYFYHLANEKGIKLIDSLELKNPLK